MAAEFPEITINAHSSIRIAGEKVLYVDPYMITKETHDADVVFFTHSHFDHMSEEDYKKVANEKTVFVRWDEADRVQIPGVSVKTVPAYNPSKPFHPKANGWVGYLLTMNDRTYYVAGDTDVTPELLSVKADVALLPVGGKYTMDAEEAAEAAKKMDVPSFIPTHYGSVAGDKDCGIRFQERLKGKKNVVLKLN